MHPTFSRILTLLRKEQGISQKEAAAALHVSQALLSHYEKGIRECGLDFVVRAADYYDVSCDYLLGRTADKTGMMITVDDIPESDGGTAGNGDYLPILNRKLTVNAVNVLYGILEQCADKELTAQASAYLDLAVYTLFRHLYDGNHRNSASMFATPPHLFPAATTAAMAVTGARVAKLAKDCSTVPSLLPEKLTRAYPLFASSLLNLIKNAETRLE